MIKFQMFVRLISCRYFNEIFSFIGYAAVEVWHAIVDNIDVPSNITALPFELLTY